MPNPIYISKKNEPVLLPFDRVKQYVVITKIVSDENLTQLQMKGMNIKLKSYLSDSTGELSKPVWKPEDKLKGTLEDLYIPFYFKNVLRVTIEVTFPKSGDDLVHPVKIHYELMDKFPMQIPDVGFTEHLEDVRNVKILFSAKFGQGKSTFLDYYFKEKEHKYNVFRLFPVNYSVASIEDIFKYIKCELIYQLLERNCDFDKEGVDHSQALIDFTTKNIHRIIAPLLLLAPKVGSSLYKIYENYQIIADEYITYHESLKTDDNLLAEEYLNEFFQKEGGLFEDDFYTQLIRQQLVKLKSEDSKKENILVIDDLDRMDPEHIFRILNVFSAHYDQFHINGNETDNKFGFDRIILVCDYENLRHIYEYKYGEKVDFTGYINKYYSTKKFDFSNKLVVKGVLEDIDRYGNGWNILRRPDYKFLYDLSTALFNAGLISLRDILNLQVISLKSIFPEVEKLKAANSYWLAVSEFVSPIILLSKTGSFNTLISNVRDLRETDFDQKMNWTEKHILIQGCFMESNVGHLRSKYKNTESYILDASFDDSNLDFLKLTGFQVIDRSLESNNISRPEYNFDEFKLLLCELIERIKSLISEF